jgi:branched-chain amino acid transport system permease protein
MDVLFFLQQLLNGLQFGVMLFLMAAGLTLVFGIMDLINLAHGSMFMVGAYLCATVFQKTGSFLLGLAVALPGTALVGIAVEVIALRTLYTRDHLDQVLATFGLILFFNELTKIIWGPRALFLDVPEALSGTIGIIPGAPYPSFRLSIIAVGIIVAVFLYVLITRTRLGMLIRASASNREMVGASGVNVKLLCTLVFGLGALLAGLAGAMTGPLLAVEVGMGEDILILAFVVVVIGGIGSIRGALVGAILVGLIDTLGRAFLPAFFKMFVDPATAAGVGSSLASMAIYILMALILTWKPEGLLPAHG